MYTLIKQAFYLLKLLFWSTFFSLTNHHIKLRLRLSLVYLEKLNYSSIRNVSKCGWVRENRLKLFYSKLIIDLLDEWNVCDIRYKSTKNRDIIERILFYKTAKMYLVLRFIVSKSNDFLKVFWGNNAVRLCDNF